MLFICCVQIIHKLENESMWLVAIRFDIGKNNFCCCCWNDTASGFKMWNISIYFLFFLYFPNRSGQQWSVFASTSWLSDVCTHFTVCEFLKSWKLRESIRLSLFLFLFFFALLCVRVNIWWSKQRRRIFFFSFLLYRVRRFGYK